jgi:GNAT superfamily N-acetyltransferase
VTRVRPGVVEDAAAIAEINVASGFASFGPDVSEDTRHSLSEGREGLWVALLSAPPPGQLVLVAETADGDVVGFVSVGPTRDEDAHAGEVYALFVGPERWRRGIGAVLLEHGESALRLAGHDSASLWVLVGNERARSFYERHGWWFEGATKSDERGVFVRYVTDL